MKKPHTAGQQGMITLLVAITWVLLAGLASVYSTRSVWLDRLASQHQASAVQARLAAEAALAWSRDELSRQLANDAPSQENWWSASPPVVCPHGYPAPRWACHRLSPPDHPALPDYDLQVLVVRDLVSSPHVVELHASASQARQGSRAQVRASLFWPAVAPAPAPDQASHAALVLQGCAWPAAGADISVCPMGTAGSTCQGPASGPAVQSHHVPDNNGDGLISTNERNRCLALTAAHLPAGGDLTSPAHARTSAGTPCPDPAWRSVLGDIRPEQIRAWSQAQERNGLHSQSEPARQIYWIDSPAPWRESLGTKDAPVLLVFSAQACGRRCPSLAHGVRIVGTVVLQTQCQDERARGWQAGLIEGQLVVESGLPDWAGGSHVHARPLERAAYRLPWPAGIDARRVQRVAGSWGEPDR